MVTKSLPRGSSWTRTTKGLAERLRPWASGCRSRWRSWMGPPGRWWCPGPCRSPPETISEKCKCWLRTTQIGDWFGSDWNCLNHHQQFIQACIKVVEADLLEVLQLWNDCPWTGMEVSSAHRPHRQDVHKSGSNQLAGKLKKSWPASFVTRLRAKAECCWGHNWLNKINLRATTGTSPQYAFLNG